MDVITHKKHKHYDGKFYWLLEDRNQVYVYIGQKNDKDEIKPIQWVYKEKFIDADITRAIILNERNVFDICSKLGLFNDLTPEWEERYEYALHQFSNPKKGRRPSVDNNAELRELVWALTHYFNGKAIADGSLKEGSSLPFTDNSQGESLAYTLAHYLHKNVKTITSAYTYQNNIYNGRPPSKDWKEVKGTDVYLEMSRTSLTMQKKIYEDNGKDHHIKGIFSPKELVNLIKTSRKSVLP